MSERPTAMRSAAARHLYYEKPRAPMHTGGVALVDGAVDYEELREHAARRLSPLPFFLHAPSKAPLNLTHPTLARIDELDLDAHVVHHRLGPDADRKETAERIGAIYSGLLDRSRPLWEVHLLEGLEGGRSAVVTKVHRCLAPELGATFVADTLFDHVPDGHEDEREHHGQPTPPPASGFGDALFDRANATVDSLTRSALRTLEVGQALTSERTLVAGQSLIDSMPDLALPVRRLPFNRSGSAERSIAGTRFSFAEAREIRKSAGGTIPDVVLAILGGAVARYCRAHGESVRGRSMRVALPVQVRERIHGRTDGRSSLIPVNVPLDITDPVKRLRRIRGTTRLMKAARVPEMIAQMLYFAGAVPPILQASFGSLASDTYPLFNMLVAYVSGPQIPLYLQGRLVSSYYPYAPVGYGQGVACTVYNYRQQLHIALSADRAACPDVDRLSDLIDEEILALKQAVGTDDIPPIRTRFAPTGSRAASSRENA
jgi:WS/DGAT/MGAT family acyltransferase